MQRHYYGGSSSSSSVSTSSSINPSSSEITTCIFDLFFDIPHPSASQTCNRAKIIEPPGRLHPALSELYDPSNISRIPKFAFPDYDEETDAVQPKLNFDSTSAILNKYDICCFASRSIHHTFSLLLDSGTRVHAHVLRYLPLHTSIKTRFDIGRRGERAMILITRSVGGINFYESLLRTLQAIGMEAMALQPDCLEDSDHDFVKAFLHSMYKKHLLLKKKFNEASATYGLKKVLNDEDKKITIRGAELYFMVPPTSNSVKSDDAKNKNTDLSVKSDNNRRKYVSHHLKKKDYISFQLPSPLQPGYKKSSFSYECENLDTPVLPLLRCLGPAKTIRLLSALLCEHRIIFTSKNVEILSACVNACTAMLAQGLLIWRHVQIPVLPPHLIQFLTTSAPYIVGVLDKYAEKIERMLWLKEALYIDLDKGRLKTLYMEDAQKKIPDLLLRKKKKNNSGVDELATDFTSILQEEATSLIIDTPLEKKIDDKKDTAKVDTKDSSFLVKLGLVKGSKKEPVISDVDFSLHSYNGTADKSTRKFRAYVLSDNQRGEEEARASLVCFFLELFGDMAMYLTFERSDSTFSLDVKKFLARKRQMGAKEDTAMFSLLKRLTQSVMFKRFTQGCISDIDHTADHNPASHILINHTPLFTLCQKHIRMHKQKFTTPNIRKVVYTTISACPERVLVDSREVVKENAMALTSEKPFEGDEVAALKTLIEICKNCDQSFVQVMQVIWLRIRVDRPTLWKHPLLGLHLLRNFLLHGPITTVAVSLGELKRIRDLMEYRGGSAIKVQTAARQVYALLKNLSRLFLRRRRVMTKKIEKLNISENVRWSSYLIRRLSPTVRFDQLHDLMRPCEEAMLLKHNIKEEVIPMDVTVEGETPSTLEYESKQEDLRIESYNRNDIQRRPSLDHNNNYMKQENLKIVSYNRNDIQRRPSLDHNNNSTKQENLKIVSYNRNGVRRRPSLDHNNNSTKQEDLRVVSYNRNDIQRRPSLDHNNNSTKQENLKIVSYNRNGIQRRPSLDHNNNSTYNNGNDTQIIPSLINSDSSYNNENGVKRRPSLAHNNSQKVGHDHMHQYDGTPYVNMKARNMEKTRKNSFEETRQQSNKQDHHRKLEPSVSIRSNDLSNQDSIKENLLSQSGQKNGEMHINTYHASFGGVDAPNYDSGFEEVKF